MTSSTAASGMGIFFLSKLDRSGYCEHVVQSLKKLNGIRSVEINYVTDKVYVNYDPAKVKSCQIRKVIRESGSMALGAARALSGKSRKRVKAERNPMFSSCL